MKKSFTLIELLITISIIVIMAVISVPAFNNYSIKADTAAKADEIKFLIEKAQLMASSPTNDSNGVVVEIPGGNDSIVLRKVNYADDCYSINNIEKKICNPSVSVDTEKINFNTTGSSLQYSKILKIGGSINGAVQIRILSPGNDNNIYFCGQGATPGTWECQNNDLINIQLRRSDLYNVVIHRYPYNVTVTRDTGGGVI